MDEAKEAALAFVAGHAVEEVVALGEEIYDELMADRIWSGTRALAQLHLDAGQRVWLVTRRPVELASIVARRLGLTGALGTVSEIRDGATPAASSVSRCTARPRRRRSSRWPNAKGWTWPQCCGLLATPPTTCRCSTTVGHPVAVNPDARLKRVARENGWDVRDFRTGRKAAKIGVPAAAGAGAIAGGVAVGLAMHRRRNAPIRRARRAVRRTASWRG